MDQKLPSAHSLYPPARNTRASVLPLAVIPPASCFHLGQKEIDPQLRIPVYPRCTGAPLLFLDGDVSRRISHYRHRPENPRSQISGRSLAVIEHLGMRRITDSK